MTQQRKAEASTAVAKYIDRWDPTNLDLNDWGQVASFIRAGVATTRPVGVDQARQKLETNARFAVWAVLQGTAPDVEIIYDPDRVEFYVAKIAPTVYAARSLKDVRSSLRRFGRSNTRRAAWAPAPPGYTTDAQAPYTLTEVAALCAAASAQSTPGRTRAFGALLYVGLGTGIDGGEHSRISGGCFRESSGILVLDVPSAPHREARTVPVTADCRSGVAELAARYRDEPLVGPVGEGTYARARLVNQASTRLDTGFGGPRVSASRLRSTWAVAQLDRGVPVRALMDALGVTTTDSLDVFVQHVAAPSAAERLALLSTTRVLP